MLKGRIDRLIEFCYLVEERVIGGNIEKFVCQEKGLFGILLVELNSFQEYWNICLYYSWLVGFVSMRFREGLY